MSEIVTDSRSVLTPDRLVRLIRSAQPPIYRYSRWVGEWDVFRISLPWQPDTYVFGERVGHYLRWRFAWTPPKGARE